MSHLLPHPFAPPSPPRRSLEPPSLFITRSQDTCLVSPLAWIPSPMPSPGSQPAHVTNRARKIASAACDACRIRKVKCVPVTDSARVVASGPSDPRASSERCQPCVDAGIECTFHKGHARRGPRNLRQSTLKSIRKETANAESQDSGGAVRSRSDKRNDSASEYTSRCVLTFLP